MLYPDPGAYEGVSTEEIERSFRKRVEAMEIVNREGDELRERLKAAEDEAERDEIRRQISLRVRNGSSVRELMKMRIEVEELGRRDRTKVAWAVACLARCGPYG